MIVHSLRLRHFRAHNDSRMTFAPKVNVLHGQNGAGKTNILEAIHYLCLSKSFLTTQDRLVLRVGAPFFELTGAFGGQRRSAVEVRLHFDPKKGKHLFTNGAPIERVADHVGMLPVVSFEPGDITITAGMPGERRRFVNNILCQAKPAYLEALTRYRRVLRQRNRLLMMAKRQGAAPDKATLASWDDALVQHGSRVIGIRAQFLTDFASFLHDAYRHLAAMEKNPAMSYSGSVSAARSWKVGAIEQAFRKQLAAAVKREHARGQTLVGPHRDEVKLTVDGLELRRYGSQGQHRTFGIAIKLAQYFYLNDRLGEPPVLLLDDVCDSLDSRRAEALLLLLQSDLVGQSLITAAGLETIRRFVPFEAGPNQRLRVHAGAVSVPDA